MPLSSIYSRTITIPKSAIDANGHVNNVIYLQWMQDIAIDLVGATWVAREHRIEYFLPAFANEVIEIRTWVENVRRVRSLRMYEFVRKSDGKVWFPGFQYTPLIVGVIVSAVILVIAAILVSIPPKPEMKVSFQDKSRESLEAERRMLKESIADVERLRKSGEVTGGSYLARLKRLRANLAENETAFKAADFPIKIESFQCPNCGGALELGMDKCEYCGQVILS